MRSKIKSLKKISGNQTRYNLEVADNHNYFANNILVHNCRCLAIIKNGHIKFVSRQGKEFTILNHLRLELSKYFSDHSDDCILDGELYIEGENFQHIVSAIKRDEPSEDTPNIEYHIYDCISAGNYEDRLNWLKSLEIWKEDHIKLAETEECPSKEDIMAFHQKYTSLGYEGVMVRNKKGYYKVNGRSSDLQKVKTFFDREFPILDVEECKGKMSGMCSFVCLTKHGIRFKCMPEGTEEQRCQYLKDWKDGKIKKGDMLKVEFFEFTVDGVPRFPIGKGIRPQWDQ